MGLFYRTREGRQMDFTLELKPDWHSDIRQETRGNLFAPEWFPQSGVEIVWPTDDTDWNYMLNEVTECYIRFAFEIAQRERLLIVTSQKEYTEKLLRERLPAKAIKNIRIFECPINDTWSRDSGVLTMVTPSGPQLLDFCFNGWGKKFEADKDNSINKALCEADILNGERINCKEFVLEGGSVETNGEGTLLTTEKCLLSSQRNPHLNKADIEQILKRTLNLQQVLWLKHGHLEGDDTDGHIDTLARLCPKSTIAYVKCENRNDPHYEELSLMENELKAMRNYGKPFNLVALPMPEPCLDKDNGERLPATYANYLVLNNAVLVPSYNQPKNDKAAAAALQNIFSEREIVSVPALPLIRQHGSLHCSAMQFPAGVLASDIKEI